MIRKFLLAGVACASMVLWWQRRRDRRQLLGLVDSRGHDPGTTAGIARPVLRQGQSVLRQSESLLRRCESVLRQDQSLLGRHHAVLGRCRSLLWQDEPVLRRRRRQFLGQDQRRSTATLSGRRSCRFGTSAGPQWGTINNNWQARYRMRTFSPTTARLQAQLNAFLQTARRQRSGIPQVQEYTGQNFDDFRQRHGWRIMGSIPTIPDSLANVDVRNALVLLPELLRRADERSPASTTSTGGCRRCTGRPAWRRPPAPAAGRRSASWTRL